MASPPKKQTNSSYNQNSSTAQHGSIPPPLNISDFQFTTIGKPPKLLARFSSPDKDNLGAAGVSSNFRPDSADLEDRSLPPPEPASEEGALHMTRTLLDRLDTTKEVAYTVNAALEPQLSASLPAHNVISSSMRVEALQFGSTSQEPTLSTPVPSLAPLSTVKSNETETQTLFCNSQDSFLHTNSTSSKIALRDVEGTLQSHSASNLDIDNAVTEDSTYTFVREIQARIQSALSSFTFPSLQNTAPLIQPIHDECALATRVAQKAHSLAERSLVSAQESIEAARECLDAAESAGSRATEVVKALEALHNDVRQSEQKWMETLACTTDDLGRLNQWAQQVEETMRFHRNEAEKARNISLPTDGSTSGPGSPGILRLSSNGPISSNADHQIELDAAKEKERREADEKRRAEAKQLMKEKERLQLETKEREEALKKEHDVRTAELDARLKLLVEEGLKLEEGTIELQGFVDKQIDQSLLMGNSMILHVLAKKVEGMRGITQSRPPTHEPHLYDDNQSVISAEEREMSISRSSIPRSAIPDQPSIVTQPIIRSTIGAGASSNIHPALSTPAGHSHAIKTTGAPWSLPEQSTVQPFKHGLSSANQPQWTASNGSTSARTPEITNKTSSAILSSVRQQQVSQVQINALPMVPEIALSAAVSHAQHPSLCNSTPSPSELSYVHRQGSVPGNASVRQPAISSRVSSESRKAINEQISVKQETVPDSILLGDKEATDRMGPDLAAGSGWTRLDPVPSPTFTSDGDRHSRIIRKEGRRSDHHSPPPDEVGRRTDSEIRDVYSNPNSRASSRFNQQPPVSPTVTGRKRHRDEVPRSPAHNTPEIYGRSVTPVLESRLAPRARNGETVRIGNGESYRPTYKRSMDSYVPEEDLTRFDSLAQALVILLLQKVNVEFRYIRTTRIVISSREWGEMMNVLQIVRLLGAPGATVAVVLAAVEVVLPLKKE
ncbi:hypothetical protein BDQ17DRAFT_1322413 [Cyathus striatus]|nr:hypothetical protein BDQ17DRAFT_1322413 [Cyathus striatus]